MQSPLIADRNGFNGTNYDRARALELYKQGYRFARLEQYGPSYAYRTDPGAAWGQGVYRIQESGEQGECVHYNYDSSD